MEYGGLTDEILDIARRNNGIVTASQVTQAGLQRRLLTAAVEAGLLIKADRGIYIMADVWGDEYVIAQYRFSRGIFSHGTALYLAGLSDRMPLRLCMTFPRGYNTKCASEAGIDAKTIRQELLALGAISVPTPYGNQVAAYEVERSLCDMLNARGEPDTQVLNPAMKAYLRSGEKDIAKLLSYADQLGVLPKVRNYLEVLL